MSDDRLPAEPPADLAAELVLGVLDAEAHRAALARMERDPAFAAEVLAWGERLAPLLDEVAPMAPSPELWPRVRAALAAESRGTVIDLAKRRVQLDSPAPQAGSGSVARWRGTALAALAASLLLAVGLGVSLMRPARPSEPLMAAQLAGDSGPSTMTAAYDPARKAMLVSLPQGVSPSDRSPELWLIDQLGKPLALGVVKSGGVASMVLAAEAARRMHADVILAISIEPLGGSPTGQPTGPVVAKGVLRAA